MYGLLRKFESFGRVGGDLDFGGLLCLPCWRVFFLFVFPNFENMKWRRRKREEESLEKEMKETRTKFLFELVVELTAAERACS